MQRAKTTPISCWLPKSCRAACRNLLSNSPRHRTVFPARWLLQPLVENSKPLVETLLSRPVAIYIDRVEVAPGTSPTVVAGLIVNCGDRKAEIARAVETLEKLVVRVDGKTDDVAGDSDVAGVTLHRFAPTPEVEIHWGFKDEYFLAAAGPNAAVELLARIGGTSPKPQWMTALEKQAAVKRISTIRYLDVNRLIAQVSPLRPDKEFDLAGLLDASGVADLSSIGCVAGFSNKGMVDRTFANFKDTPKGLFELLAGKPLTADELKPVPNTAIFAIALRLDPLKVYETLTALADKVNPQSAERFKQTTAGMAQAFGFRLKEDVLGSLGDVWTLHESAVSGPNQLAGLVVTVTLKNKEMLAKIQATALQMLKLQAQSLPFSITETKIGDVPAWQIVPVQTGAASPAWAIAGDRLIVAGSLDGLKTQIGQEAGSASLADLPAVASRLKTEPIMVSYQNTKAIVEQSIGLLRTYGPFGAALLDQQGIKFEMPALPEFKMIASHVLPRTSTLRIAKQSIISEAFETVPLVGNALSAVPVAGLSAALLGPAVQAARGATGNNNSMNNLKQIALAMQNYHDVYKKLPPAAAAGVDGKPLLSSRVKILPYVGEAILQRVPSGRTLGQRAQQAAAGQNARRLQEPTRAGPWQQDRLSGTDRQGNDFL